MYREEVNFRLTAMEILLFSSVISSSDAVAAISIINYDQQPKMFSIVFGEGITNDVIAIIIFNTIHQYCIDGSENFNYLTGI